MLEEKRLLYAGDSARGWVPLGSDLSSLSLRFLICKTGSLSLLIIGRAGGLEQSRHAGTPQPRGQVLCLPPRMSQLPPGHW